LKITLHVVCNFQNLSGSIFWEAMKKSNNIFLFGKNTSDNSLPHLIRPAEYPNTISFSSLVDDPFRSLTGFVRELQSKNCPSENKYCMRGFNKACDANKDSIFYFENRWAYFFNDGLLNSSKWDYISNFTNFEENFQSLPLAKPGDQDFDSWFDAAQTLFWLARSKSARHYHLPNGFTLPGVTNGYGPIDQPDPDCNFGPCLTVNGEQRHMN